jgi:PGF-pre-PGF domain-containing protein
LVQVAPVLGQETDVPGEDLPDVPRYPGAIRTKYSANPFLEQKNIQYRTATDIDIVQRFYAIDLQKYGWSLTYENSPYHIYAEKPGIGASVYLTTAGEYTIVDIDRAIAGTAQIEEIPAGENGEFLFENYLPISSITLKAGEVSIPGTGVSVRVRGEPAETPLEGWEVFTYVDIRSTMDNIRVESGTIEFKVSKQWVVTRNIDLTKVRLFWLSERWEELQTFMIGEDNEHINYFAKTIGFSIFAIAGRAYSVPAWYAQPLSLTLIVAAIIATLGTVYWFKLRR